MSAGVKLGMLVGTFDIVAVGVGSVSLRRGDLLTGVDADRCTGDFQRVERFGLRVPGTLYLGVSDSGCSSGSGTCPGSRGWLIA